jgi:hypothetical protein
MVFGLKMSIWRGEREGGCLLGHELKDDFWRTARVLIPALSISTNLDHNLLYTISIFVSVLSY